MANLVRVLLLLLFFATTDSAVLAVDSSNQARSSASSCEQQIEDGLFPAVVIQGQPIRPMKLQDRMEHYRVPGISLAFIHEGRLQWTRTFGVTKFGGPLVSADTLFQAGSISKSVTAAAALRMVEQGKLALDTDVNRYLTSWKVPSNRFTAQRSVTLRELLSHTAGVTVHGFPGYASDEPVPTLLQVFNGEKPANTAPIRVDITPGTQHRYSGGGYTVVHQMLTDITGESFPKLMHDLLLSPVGMTHSTFEQPLPQNLGGASTPYDEHGQPIKGGPHTYPEMAAAGLWTTASDLARFAIAIQNSLAGGSRAILSSAMAHQMLKPVLDHYGLGFSIGGKDRPYFSHGGDDAGYEAYLLAYEKGDGIAIMTNGQRGIALGMEVIHGIADRCGWSDLRPVERRIANTDPAHYPKYVGTYEVEPGERFSVIKDGNKLFIINDGEKEEMYPESDTRYFILGDDRQFTFQADDRGAVNTVAIHSPNFDASATRTK